MCINSIDETAELFSTSLKENIKTKEEWFQKQPSDLLDLAYSELVRLHTSLKNTEEDQKEEILEQALELGSLMLMIVDRASSK